MKNQRRVTMTNMERLAAFLLLERKKKPTKYRLDDVEKVILSENRSVASLRMKDGFTFEFPVIHGSLFLPEEDLPEEDLPEEDLPEEDLPEEDSEDYIRKYIVVKEPGELKPGMLVRLETVKENKSHLNGWYSIILQGEKYLYTKVSNIDRLCSMNPELLTEEDIKISNLFITAVIKDYGQISKFYAKSSSTIVNELKTKVYTYNLFKTILNKLNSAGITSFELQKEIFNIVKKNIDIYINVKTEPEKSPEERKYLVYKHNKDLSVMMDSFKVYTRDQLGFIVCEETTYYTYDRMIKKLSDGSWLFITPFM